MESDTLGLPDPLTIKVRLTGEGHSGAEAIATKSGLLNSRAKPNTAHQSIGRSRV
jgi:hypothetical protein